MEHCIPSDTCTQLAPMLMGDKEKPEETASNADTGYAETSSVVSASSYPEVSHLECWLNCKLSQEYF